MPRPHPDPKFVADVRRMFALARRVRRLCGKLADAPPEAFDAVFGSAMCPDVAADVREEIVALKVAAGLWSLSSEWNRSLGRLEG